MTITNGYCTIDDLRDWTGEQIPTNAVNRAEVVIESTSRWIDHFCGRHFYPLTATRTFTTNDYYRLALDVDLVSVTTLTVAGVSWAPSQYELLIGPNIFSSDVSSRPYRYIEPIPPNYFFRPWIAGPRDFISIAGSWGWSATPISVKQACIIQSAANLHRTQSVNGVEGLDSFGVVRTATRIDPTVAQLLSGYRTQFGLG